MQKFEASSIVINIDEKGGAGKSSIVSINARILADLYADRDGISFKYGRKRTNCLFVSRRRGARKRRD